MRTGTITAMLAMLAFSFAGSACATSQQAGGERAETASPGTRTVVEVSALANGAKFIGEPVGGVEVVIRDASTGAELARGTTQGGSGDTSLIMDDKGGRHEYVVTEDAAVFRAEILLERPRLVEVSVRGPLDYPIAETVSVSRQWLLPGEHLEGKRRIVTTLSGYIIDVQGIAVNDAGTGRISANLAMACGCPIRPDGRWDANAIDMRARLVGAADVSETVEFKYSGEGNLFVAEFSGKTRQPRRLEIRMAGKADSNTAFVTIPLLD